MAPNPEVDRMSSTGHPHLGLADWAELYGLTDVWRWRNPHRRAYTCHSASHRSFSRIDLAYVDHSALSRVKDIRILPRGVSDHAPLLLTLELSHTPGLSL